MRLGRLLENVKILSSHGDRELEIEGVAYDSREIKAGYLFVALRGNIQDGHDFINNALQNGAVALVVESCEENGEGGEDVAWIRVANSREALSKIAVNYFNHPFKGIDLVGITGTNGKTTISFLLESILLAGGGRPGVIGTINYRYPGKAWKAPVTTPESFDLMRILRKMADNRVSDVVMEVSSHALDQGRVKDCQFKVAVFTNLTRDHLDYHPSMEAYFHAKSRLFLQLGEIGAGDFAKAVINLDDPKGRDLVQMTRVPVVTYGLGEECDVRAENIQMTKAGLSALLITPSGKVKIQSSLIGNFNIYNLLAASAAALCMGVDLNTVSEGIARLKKVPGRLELVKNRRSLSVVIDYAHTPDALLKVLTGLKPLAEGRLITVFGCGGDRDKGKRRQMGRVAGEHCDLVFVTSDNPRSEDPAAIASAIEAGVRDSGLKKLTDLMDDRPAQPGYILDLDRGNAILRAVRMADEKDLIVIAGKGHEDYQIIGAERRDFDDRKVAAEAAS